MLQANSSFVGLVNFQMISPDFPGSSRIVVFHGMAVAVIHLHLVVIDAVGLDHAVLPHLHHFRLMLLVHGGRAQAEFVQEFTLVDDLEADGFPSLHGDVLRVI